MSVRKKIYLNPRVTLGTIEVKAGISPACRLAIARLNGTRRSLTVSQIPSFSDEKFAVNPQDFGYIKPYPDVGIGTVIFLEEDYPHE